jgi:hypothetical protein
MNTITKTNYFSYYSIIRVYIILKIFLIPINCYIDIELP